MKILALDLGKFKTVACCYVEGEATFLTLTTAPMVFRKLFQEQQADVVVFETCTAAG